MGIRHFSSARRSILICAVFFSAAKAFAAPGDLVTINDAASGSLLFDSQVAGQYVEAPRLATDVAITISGPIARTRVTQRFENVSDAWVEGTYVFPLPDGAAVDTLKMQIGERFIEGKIEEKQKAKAIYDQAKREGKKASLLSQQRPNIFTNAVANIGPGETIVMQIEYQENVALDGSTFSLRFPMVVAPRYNPLPVQKHVVDFNDGGWGSVDPVPDRHDITSPVLKPDDGPINPVTLKVDLDAGFAIGDIRSSFHAVTKSVHSDSHMTVQLSDETVPADRDFELLWTPQSGAAPSAALFTETVEGEDYYLLMVTPPSPLTETAPQPRDVTFVFDTSGSMQGQSIRQAREALALAITRLNAGDRFNIIQFNSSIDTLFGASQGVSEGSIASALAYIRSIDAGGGTEMLPALEAALRAPTDDMLSQVIFLTDGAIGNEQALFDTIAQQRGKSRIFTIGIGSAPNSYFMSRAAELGQGTFTHIGDIGQVRERMESLFEKLERPAVTNVTTTWPQGTKQEAWPAPIPDLYHGETLVIAAKSDAETGLLTLSGAHDGAGWQVDLPLDKASVRSGIAKLWARKKIKSLEMARASYGADRDALDSAVLETALTHGLVSRLTSLVAVDTEVSRPAEERIAETKVPHNLPKGWNFGAVFGDKASKAAFQTKRRAPLVPAAAMQLKEARPQIAMDMAQAPKAGIALPKTAALWSNKVVQGLILLLISLVLVRQIRRAA